MNDADGINWMDRCMGCSRQAATQLTRVVGELRRIIGRANGRDGWGDLHVIKGGTIFTLGVLCPACLSSIPGAEARRQAVGV